MVRQAPALADWWGEGDGVGAELRPGRDGGAVEGWRGGAVGWDSRYKVIIEPTIAMLLNLPL